MFFNRVMNQFKAALYGDLQQLRVALTVDNVNDVDVHGWTALHFVGSVGCVNYCIEMGANVNARDIDGWTPLHHASLNGQIKVVRVLLEAGAIVDATTNVTGFSWTPLYWAILNKHVDVARLLIDWGGNVSNVELDFGVPAIPDLIAAYAQSRSNCRTVSITIMGIHKYHRTTVTGNNDINVLRLISKLIWSTRKDDGWTQSQLT
jgi:ankyrin repeat protein